MLLGQSISNIETAPQLHECLMEEDSSCDDQTVVGYGWWGDSQVCYPEVVSCNESLKPAAFL